MTKKFKITTIFMIVVSLLFTVGFSFKLSTPRTVYRVYLKGKSLGIIESKKELEEYINQEQKDIKKKYKVDKVYAPEDLDIVKEITFNNDLTDIKKLYKKIEKQSPFSIKGYKITIKNVKSATAHDEINSGNKTIYVLDKGIFTESINNSVKSFIPENDYKAFADKTQEEIDDTGKIIEKIYLENKVTIKKQNIPVDKKIYQDKAELSQYLLFGTNKEQQSYIVQDGDTIADIANNNKMSTEEFLIANPSYSDENSLLAPGQEVSIGLINPQFNVVEEDYVVEKVAKKYTTEVKYDNNKFVGYEVKTQNGVEGINKVTQRIKKVNGAIKNIEPLSTEVIKDSINEIIVKGGKKYGHGYGNIVATKGSWGWPATCSSISSPYGWRGGGFHKGVDIAGCGEGSYIFAAQAGKVVRSYADRKGGYAGGYGMNGEYIVIDHGNGYFSEYAHMCPGCRYVREGDYVEKGQPIGGMGRTGAATGVHLHFGMWQGYPHRGGQAFNPMTLY